MWHIRTALAAMAGVWLIFVPAARADSLQLKNGNFLQGKFLGGTERAVQFEVNGKVRVYGTDEILSISFAAASADGGIPSNASAKPSASESNCGGRTANSAAKKRILAIPTRSLSAREQRSSVFSD
jgi:hypothetical protein